MCYLCGWLFFKLGITVSVWCVSRRVCTIHLVGLARPFCLYPYLANQIFDGSVKRFDTPTPKIGVKFLDKLGGVELPWYELQIQSIGKGKSPKSDLSGILAFWFSLKSLFLKSFWKNK